MPLEIEDTIMSVYFKNGMSIKKRLVGKIGLENVANARIKNIEESKIFFDTREGTEVAFDYNEVVYMEFEKVSNLDSLKYLGDNSVG